MIRILVASFCVLISLQSVRGENHSTADAGAVMTSAAQKFVASLSKAESAKATMKFDDPARLDWNNIPKPKRKGLQFGEMNAAQQELCRDLIRAALSESGYDKVTKIMSLENNLREGEKTLKDGPLRDPGRYFLTIFGKPDAHETWGWSFEGHHLSLNFVIRNNEVISDTPSFWGANPATVTTFIDGGPAVGTRTLGKEEQLAFDLMNGFDDSQKGKAIIAEKAPADYRAAGQPQPPHSVSQGLAATDLSDAQQKTLWSLLEEYNSHFHPRIAQKQLSEIKAAGVDRIYFAWAGATKPGVGHYYRVQGPTFVLELINVQADPAGHTANHIHSVWRSLQGDFAVPDTEPLK